MMGSKFVAAIREDVEEMEQKLKYIDIVIAEWTTFQRSWMYLENIFSADDIRE
jgi:dynein heavy chain